MPKQDSAWSEFWIADADIEPSIAIEKIATIKLLLKEFIIISFQGWMQKHKSITHLQPSGTDGIWSAYVVDELIAKNEKMVVINSFFALHILRPHKNTKVTISN